MASEKQYIELYQQAREMIFSHAPEAMNAVRDQAFEDFRQQGFPSKKVERYKYTDIQKLFEPDYGVNLSRLQIPVDPYETFRCDVPNLSTSLYFVVNDMFYTQSQPKGHLPEGVIVGSLRDYPELIGKYYAKLAKTSEDAVTALNTMLAQDGLLVYVPKNVKVDRAIQVINILKATPQNAQRQVPDLMVNRRVLIILEEGAEIKMLFCDHAADDRNFLATQVIEAYVGDNASLDLYCLEETHYKNVRVSNVYIDQQTNSRVNHNVITLHNGITRNKLDLTFSGEGAECACYGCVIADKEQHVDNNTSLCRSCAGGAWGSEDHLADDQSESDSYQGGAYVHPADAGDLCRRCEVCPWFYGGSAQRRGPLLYASARYLAQRGKDVAPECFYQRGDRQDAARASARPSAPFGGETFPRRTQQM